MTILIKNAQLIDGSGKQAVKADVLVKKNKIAVIDNLIKYKAGETIDAMGAYLTPGFIDIATYNDRNLDIFLNPGQENLLKQGVTTIIGGHNGFSLAPLLYGSLEALRPWADIRRINVNWHTFAEFFKTMKKKPLGVNFGTLLGHTTVRLDIVHDSHNSAFRDLTQNETAVLSFVMRNGLKDGAFGISTGLDNPLVSEASYFEIKKMAELTIKTGALFSLNVKDNKEGLIESVKKAIFLAKETGAKIFINNFKLSREAFDLIEENSNNADIYFNVDPAPFADCFSKNTNDVDIHKRCGVLKSDRALVSSGGFQKFLGLIGKGKVLSIEEAIKKITFLPAQKLKLNKRGLIKEGYFADLVIFKPACRQAGAEIREVILNGKRAVKEGIIQNVLGGEFLKRE